MQYQFHGSGRFGRRAVSTSFSLSGLLTLSLVIVLGLGPTVMQTVAADDADAAIGNMLADMLRASRSVVSTSQSLINDAAIGDKDFTGVRLVHEAETIYAERVGHQLLDADLSVRDRRLLKRGQRIRRIPIRANSSNGASTLPTMPTALSCS